MNEMLQEEAQRRRVALNRNERRLLTILRCELSHGPGYFQFGQWVQFPSPDSPYRKIDCVRVARSLRARLEWLFEDMTETCFYVYDTTDGSDVEAHETELVADSGDAIARIVLGNAVWEFMKC